MAGIGATVLNCPRTYARAGVTAAYSRFRKHGVRTLVATDGYNMDLLSELNAAALISKCTEGRADVATSRDLIGAVTRDAADALARPDLGRIEPGATADLTAVSLRSPLLRPVHDPLKAVVALASRADVDIVINAQLRLAPFYRSLGFDVEGVPYDEDGIEHVAMRRRAGILATGGGRSTAEPMMNERRAG